MKEVHHILSAGSSIGCGSSGNVPGWKHGESAGGLQAASVETVERPMDNREAGGSSPSLRANIDNLKDSKPREQTHRVAAYHALTSQGVSEGGGINGVPRQSSRVVASTSNDKGSAKRAQKKMRSFQLRWREPLGLKECPYAYRWTLNVWLFSVRVHQWIRSDDKRHLHDHPWHFATIVLRGSYVDVSETGRDQLRLGSVRFRHATHKHYVEVPKAGALTLLITGAPVRDWGFWVKGKFKRPLRYFGKFGHPPCDEQ